MSKLNDLIKNLCPNGVEFKKLGEVINISKGVQFNKSDMQNEGSFPVINGGINPSGYIEKYNQYEKTITISQGGASAGYVNWLSIKFCAGAHCYIVKTGNNILNRYVFHFLKSKEKNLQECQYGAGIPALAKSTVENLIISVPPLEVQAEIVRILDTFTELTAELALRKKQYEYYRDLLLTFEGVEYKTLGEIGKVSMCKRILKAQTNTEGGVPFYKIGTFGKKNDTFISYELWQDYKQRFSFPKNGEILISAAGTIGRTVIYNGESAYWQDSNIVWLAHDEKILLNKFLYYIYQTKPFKISTGGTIQRLYNGDIENTKIPVPPLAEQERIVEILDKFDKLCNDLSAGLPAEIAARKKQYEYYRDKLLTFEEAK